LPPSPQNEIDTVIATPRLKLEEHCNDAVACCRQYAGAAAGDWRWRHRTGFGRRRWRVQQLTAPHHTDESHRRE